MSKRATLVALVWLAGPAAPAHAQAVPPRRAKAAFEAGAFRRPLTNEIPRVRCAKRSVSYVVTHRIHSDASRSLN
jgi:hypothetical protein